MNSSEVYLCGMNFLHALNTDRSSCACLSRTPNGGMLADWSSDAKVLNVLLLCWKPEWSHHTLAMAQAAGTKCCVPGLRKRP
jgi:hypothetical protein